MNFSIICLDGTAPNSGAVWQEEFGGGSAPVLLAYSVNENGEIWCGISTLVK